MCKIVAIVLAAAGTLSLLLSIFEPTSSNDLYHTGMLQMILCLMLWDRGNNQGDK
jgi:hypothetical protein